MCPACNRVRRSLLIRPERSKQNNLRPELSLYRGKNRAYPTVKQTVSSSSAGNLEVRFKSAAGHFDSVIFRPASGHVEPRLSTFAPSADAGRQHKCRLSADVCTPGAGL